MKISNLGVSNSYKQNTPIKSFATTNVSSPITFGRKNKDTDVFSKSKHNDVVNVKGFDKSLGVKFVEKQTKEGQILERKTFFEDGKTIWKKADFKNGIVSKVESYSEDGEIIWSTKYTDGVISEETHYHGSEKTKMVSFTKKGIKLTDCKIPNSIESIKEYNNGKISQERFFYEDGKTPHFDYKYDDDSKLTGITSYREDGTRYHSRWEASNGFCTRAECEDELGISLSYYDKFSDNNEE